MFFSCKSSTYHYSETVKARELKFWENVHPSPCVQCHMWSHVISKIKTVDFLMKILKKIIFLRKYTFQNIAILHLLVYCRPILIYFSGKKRDFQIFRFPPLKNPRFLIITFKKKGGKARMIELKFWNLKLKLVWCIYSLG